MSNSLIFNSFQQNVDVLWEMLLVHFYKFSFLWCSVRDDIRLDLIAYNSEAGWPHACPDSEAQTLTYVDLGFSATIANFGTF